MFQILSSSIYGQNFLMEIIGHQMEWCPEEQHNNAEYLLKFFSFL